MQRVDAVLDASLQIQQQGTVNGISQVVCSIAPFAYVLWVQARGNVVNELAYGSAVRRDHIQTRRHSCHNRCLLVLRRSDDDQRHTHASSSAAGVHTLSLGMMARAKLFPEMEKRSRMRFARASNS